MSGSTKHLFPRPLGPVSLDEDHLWLPYPLTPSEAELFTRNWRRLSIPFVEVPVESSERVWLYAHQHVANHRWRCAPLSPARGRRGPALPPSTSPADPGSSGPRFLRVRD